MTDQPLPDEELDAIIQRFQGNHDVGESGLLFTEEEHRQAFKAALQAYTNRAVLNALEAVEKAGPEDVNKRMGVANFAITRNTTNAGWRKVIADLKAKISKEYLGGGKK